MKVCSKCKVEKEESEFYSSKYKNKLGKKYSAQCKPCQKITRSSDAYRRKNNIYQGKRNAEKKEMLLPKRRDRRLKNAEKYRQTDKAYYLKNINKHREKANNYYHNNSEKIHEYNKKKVTSLHPSYIKIRLRKQGYSKDCIENVPVLMPIKQIEIINHRVKKLKNK